MYAIYEVVEGSPARWLIKKCKTLDEILRFLKEYKYDANVIDENGEIAVIKFDGKIMLLW